MIEVKNIVKSYGVNIVLGGISFTVPDCGIHGIFGPSGCGKTTLLRLIAGLEKADSGEITGTEGKKIAFVFQEDRLIPSCTALKNVSLVSDEETALKYLKLLHLEDALDKYPDEMSGGMCRRVAIARALACGGDILILDEPFKGIETELKNEVQGIVKEYAETHPVLFVTHDEDEKLIAGTVTLLKANESET